MRLADLKELGVEVAVRDGDLVVRASRPGVLKPELLEQIRQRKAELIRERRCETGDLVPLIYRRNVGEQTYEFELLIPRERYDAFALLDIIDRQCRGVYADGDAFEIARKWAEIEKRTETQTEQLTEAAAEVKTESATKTTPVAIQLNLSEGSTNETA